MPSTSTDLDALWLYCEHEGCITPALVDYTRESGDDEYADFLEWAWRKDRWPVGGSSVQFRWGRLGLLDRRENEWIRSNICNLILGKLPNINLYYKLFPTASEAFEYIYRGWQRLTEQERRELE